MVKLYSAIHYLAKSKMRKLDVILKEAINISLRKGLTHCFKLPKFLAIISQLIHPLLGV